MRKTMLILGAFLFFAMALKGQTDIQLSQQLFSRMNYNPAATGATNFMDIYLFGRQQFVGFDGAPRTQVLNFHSYVEPIRSGLGLSVTNDKIFVESTLDAKVNYAYHLFFKEEVYLSLGLAAGIVNKTVDYSGLIPQSEGDPLVLENDNKLSPDFNAGLEFNYKRFKIGTSITHFTQKALNDGLAPAPTFYAYAKYKFMLGGENWSITPYFSASAIQKTMQFETTGLLSYRDILWAGVSYRADEQFRGESVVGMVGTCLFDLVRLGYAYDYYLGSFSPYSSGAHEIMVSFKINHSKEEAQARNSPRFLD